MAEPTEKSIKIERMITRLVEDRVKAIRADVCVNCGGEATTFRDQLSHREYRISGLCQVCQDLVWGTEGEEGEAV